MSDPLTDLEVGAESFLTAVLDATAQPIWVVDADGFIRFANPAAIATLGYDRAEELLGRPSHETIHHSHPDGSHYPADECPMLLPRETGETVATDLDWFFRSDGSMFPVSYVSVPIEVAGGRGAVVAFTDIEGRRDVILGEEQSALRRLAAVVAGGADSSEVFAAVAREVANVFGVSLVVLSRYEPDDGAIVVGSWCDRAHPFQVGTRWPLDGPTVAALVRRTGAPVRVGRYAELAGTVAEAVRGIDMRSGAGAPIVVAGALWGVIAIASLDEELPDRVETRLAVFTELMGTAVANTEAREQLQQLADEQSALRRVATLVAQGSPPAEVFAAVAHEVSHVLHLPLTTVARVGADHVATIVGAAGDHPHASGVQYLIEGPSASAMVLRTGRPARMDREREIEGTLAGVRRAMAVSGTAAAPIVVDGRTWGIIASGVPHGQPLPVGVEHRLTQFTALVATAISNSQAHEDLERLADEQAALRRIATLVAEGADPTVVFDTVCEETGRLLGATTVNLAHFTPEGINVTMSGWSLRGVHVPTGTQLAIDGGSVNALVRTTARPARCDTYEGVEGTLAAELRRLGIRSEVGAPVVVEGAVWGGLFAGTDDPEPLPPGSEARLAGFAELIATAVSNATARSELIASRARLVEAADEQRRRVVRDLHDGAQQRFVHAIMTLQRARRRSDGDPEIAALIDESLAAAGAGLDSLRELARGIHPAILTNHGLAAAVEALADLAPLPVDVDIADTRYPASVESAAYFVVAEALTNVAKYARARTARVTAAERDGRLHVEVTDDGVGGARAVQGSGLTGLQDRVAALDGAFGVDSPDGGGTHIVVEIPVRSDR